MNELVSIILLQHRDLNKFKDFIRIFRYQTYTNYEVFISLKNNNLYDEINLYLKELERIIIFLKKYTVLEASEKKRQNIIKTTNFNSLKKMEKDGFLKKMFSTI